ncbi:Biogenesis of lysosome-related organelles complex 1 subunit 2-like [Oopsacas minuta]|uniref:Biogenesis of lysosome-related organelles complex 1 subunit 2-like n=1 Tax=Oopsacas minuta TaxID=111878 RepID=A0AAV7KCQ8_9METZ|nr:Biogenesis of lysosome-related organelles complex 1 subunit 2-like [Oopsacas minuta]
MAEDQSPTRTIEEVTSRTDTRNEMRAKSRKMFEDVKVYVHGEIEANASEYELLENMNNVTTSKYKHLTIKCKELSKQTQTLNETYEELAPYFAMINQLDSNLGQLEIAVMKLDSATKQIENKFKSLTK